MRNIVLQISNLIRIKTKTPVSGVSPDEPLEQAWHKANTMALSSTIQRA